MFITPRKNRKTSCYIRLMLLGVELPPLPLQRGEMYSENHTKLTMTSLGIVNSIENRVEQTVKELN